MKNLLRKMSKTNYIIILLILILLVSTLIPSLARYKNRTSINEVTVWDGSVATKYRKGSGTSDDPYIISNGSEFAYFASMLKTTDYSNTYFELNNDIVLNDGLFSYDLEGIKYKLSNTTFYVKENTNEIYDNIDKTGTKIKSINMIESLENFKGNLNGNSYRIYGLYISGIDNVGLFKELNGNISNLYIENAIIYGGNVTAGIAANATDVSLSNILFEGNVIGNSTTTTKETVNISLNHADTIKIPYSNITNVTVTGNTDTTIKINDNEVSGTINLELGSIDELIIDTNSLINLTYEVTYKTNITSGLIANGENITLTNVINKANITGDITSSLIGNANNATINNSYNKGTATAFINIVKGTLNIAKSYSTNTTYAINNAIDSTLNINNSFFTDTAYVLNNLINTTSNITNSYYTDGTASNEIINGLQLTNLTNLQNKDFVINNLQFNEYNGDFSGDNIWVYEDGELPILAIDDIVNPIANIYLGTYNWNNLGYELNTIKLNSATAFSISEVDPLRPLNEIYYYISDKVLTLEELENVSWNNYTNIVEIKDEGKYVIYAKVVSDKTYYLNTDMIILDFTKADVSINIKDKQYTTLNEQLDYLFINDETNFIIDAQDDLSGIKSVEYYIASEVLTLEQLNNLSWLEYQDNLKIDTKGKYIIYAKVVDNMDYINYVNTDYIVYDGYDVTIDNNNITNNSEVTLNFKYNIDINYQDTFNHKIVTNQPLPNNTKITLIDNVNDKVYTYKVEQEQTTYSFTLFKEVGSIDKLYQENNSGNINEDYTVIIKFNNTTAYQNFQVSLELFNNDTSYISTLKQNIKPFNIYTNNDSYPYINTDFSGSINLNSNTVTDININAGLINNQLIKDTTYNDKLLGIAIKLVDSNNNVVSKEYLNNIKFKLDDNIYSPNDDGIVRINLNTNQNVSKTLKIETTDASVKLSGNYYFKIASYYAYDGVFTNNYSNEITIPLSSNIEDTNTYNFDVLLNSSLSKNDTTLDLNILTDLENPTVYVSLYKKTEFTAYNQDYVLIDLNNYATNIEKVGDKIYKLNSNTLNIKNFTSGGYEFAFELYDNNIKVATIYKKFIVR